MPEKDITRKQRDTLVESLSSQGAELLRIDDQVLGTGIWDLNGERIGISSPEAEGIWHRHLIKTRGMSRGSQTHLVAEMQRAPLKISYSDTMAGQIDKIFDAEPQPGAETP